MPANPKYAPQARYHKKNYKQIAFALNTKTDADIIEHLESKENVNGYIKALIRADMAKEKSPSE